MGKKFVIFPRHPVDEPVKEWLESHNLSAEDVRAFNIARDSRGGSWLTLEVWFNPAPEIDVTGIDKSTPEYLPKE